MNDPATEGPSSAIASPPSLSSLDGKGGLLSPRTRATSSIKSASPLLARGEHWSDQLTPEQLKQLPIEQKQKQEAIQEIVLAERAYVRDLRIISKVFMEDMKERGLITKEEMASIFSNIPTLLDVHNALLDDLEHLKKEQGMLCDDGIGRIFLDRANLFKHYANYCVNHIGMSQKLAALREHPKFVEFLEECKKNPECRNLTLESFLITPLQRMAKYPLLIQSLLKYMEKDNPEYPSLLKAYEEIKHVVDQVNNRAQQEENARKMMELQAAVELVHGEVHTFYERGRYIVKEGPVRVAHGRKKNKADQNHLVLFNDKLVLFKIKMKGKKLGYKMLATWLLPLIVVSPLDAAPSSPFSITLPPNVRHRGFSRSGSETATSSSGSPRLSLMLSSSPIYQSPRSRLGSLRKEGDALESLEEVECGIKISEKESGSEHRLVFPTSIERDDWIVKMKDVKIEFKSEVPADDVKAGSPLSGSESPSASSMWERKYHVEVEIRTELKKVLDQTMAQLSALREEVEMLKKEKEDLKAENERLRSKAWKQVIKKKRRERGGTEGSYSICLSDELEALGGSEIQPSKDRSKIKFKTKDKKEKEKDASQENQETTTRMSRSRSLGSSFSAELRAVTRKALDSTEADANSSSTKEQKKEEKEAPKKHKTLGRKSLGLPGRVKKEQPMPFLDLPCVPVVGSDTMDADDESVRFSLFTKPHSARERTKPNEPVITRARLLSDGGTDRLSLSCPPTGPASNGEEAS